MSKFAKNRVKQVSNRQNCWTKRCPNKFGHRSSGVAVHLVRNLWWFGSHLWYSKSVRYLCPQYFYTFLLLLDFCPFFYFCPIFLIFSIFPIFSPIFQTLQSSKSFTFLVILHFSQKFQFVHFRQKCPFFYFAKYFNL